MLTITIDEMADNLFDYLQQVEDGETLLVTRSGKPVAEIKPATAITTKNGEISTKHSSQPPYTPVALGGLWQGTIITDEDIESVRQEMWGG